MALRGLALLVLAALLASSEPIGPKIQGLVTIPTLQKTEQWPKMRPSVFVALLCRNKAHLLRNSLGYLEEMDYPKDRITMWIHTDHNQDNTAELLTEWKRNARYLFHDIKLTVGESDAYTAVNVNGTADMDWSDERYVHVLKLRQAALEAARQAWADYILYVDCDNFLVNNQTLNMLIEQRRPVVAPMLISKPKSAYSNFWCGMDDNGYYRRTPEYIPTLLRERVGCFEVVMVHSTYLINLRLQASQHLAFWPPPSDYKKSIDDILVFAHTVVSAGLKMYILNTEYFGQMTPTADTFESLAAEAHHYEGFKQQFLVDHKDIPYSPFIEHTWQPEDNLGFDEIYLINLARREDRRERMLRCFQELRLPFKWIAAVDGKNLTQEYKDSLGIKMMENWEDPFGKRPITDGEIGCFLSHYKVWKDVVDRNLGAVMVIEDDAKFEPGFNQRLIATLDEIEQLNLAWDLIYLGRKRLEGVENWVPGSKYLVTPNYSYWTVAYLLSARGARKLLKQEPLTNILPVDEYLPIMFDNHPRDNWKLKYSIRDLVAFSVHPLLIYPTHYVGDEGYFSDTEPASIWLERHKIRAAQRKEKERTEL
ncbi:procollagen galactosyltransferase 1-like [Sycon ciliatum]|uniref:procollagen galactosyltransferase 1-like n=1 Tax=Sycon ciliatum TaxID=27933 RepID=UPI0020AC380E